MEALLIPYLARFTMEELFLGLEPKRILIGMTLDIARLVQNPHLHQRRFFVTQTHPVAGALTYPGAPFQMSQTPWQWRCPAPLLGQHNVDVYCGMLGHTPAELATWHAAGIV